MIKAPTFDAVFLRSSMARRTIRRRLGRMGEPCEVWDFGPDRRR